jgi:hypothetical protein
MKLVLRACASLLALCVFVVAQETRSTVNGRVYDSQSAAIAGAKVTVTHTDTNTSTSLTTNATGFYDAPLLIPGNYKVTATAEGFKTTVREGITLQVSQTISIDLKLDLGAVSETVQVTAEAPVLDVNPLESGALIDNDQLMDLPVLGNNPTLLAKLMPGMQTDGINNYLGLHSIAGASTYNNAGGVGGNDWSIDGVPNNGGSRQAAYLPYSDSIAEFRIDLTGFDVSQGRGTGAQIVAMTKSGTNAYHGTATEQHWQLRFNGTPYFTRQLYLKNIADAEAKGDTALAGKLRATERQPSGHSNNWAGTIGGPVYLPKLYNGRNKFFFFFNFNGFKDNKTEEPTQFNKTVPTMANRTGDFSDLVAVDAVKYSLFDPLTVRRNTERTGGTYYVRDPLPGNRVPLSRITMPKMYNFVKDLYPVPNNNPTSPKQEPLNNYLAVYTPWLWTYRAYQNRLDFNHSNAHRFYGRWSWNNFDEDRQDWTYSTIRGMNTGGLNRKNMAATVGWTWAMNSSTVLDVSGAANQFSTGNNKPVPLSYKPSDLGLPAYLDSFAGDRHMVPRIAISGYTEPVPTDGYPSTTKFRVYSVVGNLQHLRGKHTFKAGADTRLSFRTGGGGGYMSGYYQFDNRYTRRDGDTALYTPGSIGLSWAAFMMGLNYNSQVSQNDTYATYSPYYGGYFQDQFRVSRKVTLYLGLRLEYEGGPTERYNRMIGFFDPTARLFVSDVAENFYKANPTVTASSVLGIGLPGRDPSTFTVRGGTTFPGKDGVTRYAWQGQVMAMPRVSFAWNVTPNTVIRGGTGAFYDTLNVTNNTPNQTGFNQTTSYGTDNNSGLTWRTGNPAAGISPMMDPFPPVINGQRYNTITSGALGVNTLTGRSYSSPFYDTNRAHQYRWRLGFQRQIGRLNLVSITYSGSYSADVNINKDMNPVPAQYWWNGNSRETALTSWLNGGVSNPFRLPNNFPTLAAENPALYADMNSQTFFTNSTISRAQLLKPYPQMTGLTQQMSPLGRVATNGVEATFNRRFTRGWNMMLAYTGTKARAADWFPNPWNERPAWEESNASRPHRFTATGMYQFPFGRRRAFFQSGPLARVLGGMQLSGTFEYQSGPLLGWSNRYYYGDISAIVKDDPTLAEWFNAKGTACSETPGANTAWERCSQRGPNTYQVRVFPNRIAGLRRDRTLQTNANVQKEIPLRAERVKFILRFDVLNVFNRYQFDNPNTDPMNTNFGIVQSQTAATQRFLQFQGRIVF